MTLIKDLIEIPEHIQKGDFVLKLTEGVTRPEETIGQYVVPPSLARCFDDALAFVRSALESKTSKACYLHGSFGSGKSHFMAVLSLLLEGHPAARARPELAGVVTKHNAWIGVRKFLVVPFHMTGSANLEAGVLGGYVDYVRRVHPEAPIPGVYLAEGLFRDAARMRAQMGDEKFLPVLNSAPSLKKGWGELGKVWTADRFEQAIVAEPQHEERTQLVSTLVETIFSSYDQQAKQKEEAFLSLDQGLSVISHHARQLGYDAVVLFLDELILWLAGHMSDLHFVHQQTQKLAKLVEAQSPDRPAPLISFVARQRDLRQLVGDAIAGAEWVSFSEALSWQEGRFHTIVLEDRNLPEIAHQRLLKPKNSTARQELDAAFEQTAKVRQPVLDVLLTSEGDKAMFHKVYPFSPALVQTLVALSSALQRDRTALKAMLQLLVEQRDTLTLGDLVPVGDLYDVIAYGDEQLNEHMKRWFDNAKRLYQQRLRPLLEQQHGRLEELELRPYDDPQRTAFRNDDRLLKSLLLSALVPELEVLRALTADRLAALNHGTIKTPIPGREGQEVLRRCRQWASAAGEIRIGEGANPVISVHLSGVDIQPILDKARTYDSYASRVKRVREMVYEMIGVPETSELFLSREFLWRNTRRQAELVFGNVRELADSSLTPDGDTWRVVIDYPFDQPGHGPRDDLGRIQKCRDGHPVGMKTIAWIPAFLSTEALRDLGTLVVVEHVLRGTMFESYTSDLSPQDRPVARELLDNQATVLRQRVQAHLEAAYGLEQITPGSIDPQYELEPSDRFQSLLPGFSPRPSAKTNLKDALEDLLNQAWSYDFPAHPQFEAEVKPGLLKKVFEVLTEPNQRDGDRIFVDKTLRPLMRQVAEPLKLGQMGADVTHFLLSHHWQQHFHKKQSESGAALTVADLRRWIDEPKPMGLPKEAANLVILAFADQTQRAFTLHNGPCDVSLGQLPDQAVLELQQLPPEDQWRSAIERAGKILGAVGSPLLNASNAAKFAAEVRTKAQAQRAGCQQYVEQLVECLPRLGLEVAKTARGQTAVATRQLLEALAGATGHEAVATLAGAQLATSADAMGTAFAQGGTLAGQLADAPWALFAGLERIHDERSAAAKAILQSLREALAQDEHVTACRPALKTAEAQAVRLLAPPEEPSAQPPQPTAPPPAPPAPPISGPAGQASEVVENLTLEQARQTLDRVMQQAPRGGQVRFSLRWWIAPPGGDP